MREFALTIHGTPIPVPSGVLNPTTRAGSLGENVIRLTVEILLIFGVVLALFFIIYSGIMWITSGGDKEKLQKARSRLTYSIIGLIVIFLAFFIINIIGGLFGVNLIKQP